MRVLFYCLFLMTLLTACGDPRPPLNEISRFEFATLYAAAWSSQDPEDLASFYAEDGMLIVNKGEPAVGREAIEAKAEDFMKAFPDMLIRVDKLIENGDRVVFHWHWTGTHSGRGGTGNPVDLRGYEVWTFNDEGLITESLGNYDEEEYDRQVYAGFDD